MSASIKTTDFNRTIPRTQLRALTFPIASNPGEREQNFPPTRSLSCTYGACRQPALGVPRLPHSCNAIMGNFDQEEEPQDVHEFASAEEYTP